MSFNYDDEDTSDPKAKHRAWIFTVYAGSVSPTFAAASLAGLTFGTKAHADVLFAFVMGPDAKVKAFVAGSEVCPETKRVHYQCYLQASYGLTRTAVQQWIHCSKCRIRPAKGSPKQNEDYCEKDGPAVCKRGKFPGKAQGARCDLMDVVEMVEEGASLRDIAAAHPKQMIKYPNGIKTVHGLLSKPRTEMTRLHILWGVTHSGKSHTAFIINGCHPIKLLHGFWHGVDNTTQPVCIEEFSWLDYPIDVMLGLVDKYALILNIKNGECQFRASDLFLTSNIDPEEWYVTAPLAQQEAWKRRIVEVKHFTSPYVPPIVDTVAPTTPALPTLARHNALLTPTVRTKRRRDGTDIKAVPFTNLEGFEEEDLSDAESSHSDSFDDEGEAFGEEVEESPQHPQSIPSDPDASGFEDE